MNTLDRDKQLVAEILNGKRQALSELVHLYHTNMTRIARSFVGDANAEDVVQEAWVSVVRSLGTFKGEASFKTWMTRITINAAKTRLRKEAKHISHATVVEDLYQDDYKEDGTWRVAPIPWDDESPDALLQSEQVLSAIAKTIDKLPDNQRIMLTLHDLEGVLMEDVCNQLDITTSNGRVILHRARLAVKAVVNKLQEV